MGSMLAAPTSFTCTLSPPSYTSNGRDLPNNALLRCSDMPIGVPCYGPDSMLLAIDNLFCHFKLSSPSEL